MSLDFLFWREVLIPPPLEGTLATDTSTPSCVPVVYKISGPMGGDFTSPIGAESFKFSGILSKESAPPLYQSQSSVSELDGLHRSIPESAALSSLVHELGLWSWEPARGPRTMEGSK